MIESWDMSIAGKPTCGKYCIKQHEQYTDEKISKNKNDYHKSFNIWMEETLWNIRNT